jgi:cell division protein FtsA
MNLPFLTHKNPQDKPFQKENILAMDIGTEVLKSLLFSTDENGINIRKISRIQQQQHAMSKGMITNLNTVLENCRLSVSELTSGIPEEELPTKVVMGIAGEYVQGVSIIVNYEREERFEHQVDQKEQEKIINKVYEQIAQSGKEDLAHRTGLLNEDIEILHITVTGMEIGGMNVESLVGFSGKSVKLYFYASFAPKTFVESLKSLSKSLGLELMGIVSQPFAVARAFAGARNRDFSAIFVDIGGGTTDIAVVEKGNVIDTQMFAFGGRVFTKEIARSMNLDYRHADARKVKYSDNQPGLQLEKKTYSEVKTICYNTSEIWMKSLQSALEMSEDVEAFPSQIFLCGGGALLPDIKNSMLEFPWTRLLPFASVPKINIFLPNRLDGVTDATGKAVNTYDITPISLAKFAYDKIKNPANYYEV